MKFALTVLSAALATLVSSVNASYYIKSTANVRYGPGTSYQKLTTIAGGTTVKIPCQQWGETVTVGSDTSALWDLIDIGSGAGETTIGYVWDGYVHTGSSGMVSPDCCSIHASSVGCPD
ncbi:hypothetical protein BGW37DRAFT_204417 [Umbelopsis sp. PMI_123]|jgi:uncharacterized protein YraI|nr:hypothetical protein BGW37DRAFT_204417 [Umbelopsis sp. PMI_123]